MINLAIDWYTMGEIGLGIAVGVIFFISIYLAVRSRQERTFKGDHDGKVWATANKAAFGVTLTSEGIKESGDVSKFLASLVNAVFNSKKDGKLNIMDAQYFFGAIMAIFPALTGINQVGKEFKDLTEEEKDELVRIFKSELIFDFTACEEAIESLFESSLNMFLSIDKIAACK